MDTIISDDIVHKTQLLLGRMSYFNCCRLYVMWDVYEYNKAKVWVVLVIIKDIVCVCCCNLKLFSKSIDTLFDIYSINCPDPPMTTVRSQGRVELKTY